jgi:hypothetical protein
VLKTVVNFRYDETRLSIDSSLTREWDPLLVEAAKTMRNISDEATQVLYESSPLHEGMKELMQAQRGMVVRASFDGAVKGPFVLDHEVPLSDKQLIKWYRANKRKGRK